MLTPPKPPINSDELDELFKNAVEIVCQYDKASSSLLQRRLDIGYARAARLIDQLKETGVIGPPDGAKPREVLIHDPKELFEKLEGEHAKEPDDPLQFLITTKYQLT